MMRKASVKDVDEQRGRASSIADSKSGARVAQLSNMNPSNPAMIINPLDQKQHTLKRKLRHKVSADRHRFQDGRYDIDLSYITPRLMAMAFPGEGMEKTWRNNINTVASFFQEYHKGAFMVWNLTEKGYDYSKFGNNVRHLGFPDHHPPPIDLLFKIVHSLDEWLSSDGIRVAAIHCLGGKGRTGVVIACYLMFSGMFPHISEALNYFAEKRSAISNGVRQPSQLRYVYYFEKTLRSGLRPFPRMVTLKKIEISPVPNVEWGGCRPVLKIYSSHKYPKVCIFSEVGRDYDLKNQTGILFDFTVDGSRGIPIQGDIMIQLSHKTSFKKVLLFQCSFHTFFLDYSVMTLPVEELDGTKKSIKFFDEHCTVSLHFGGSKGVPQTHIGRGKNAMELQKDPSLDRIYKSIFNRSSVPVQKCQKSGKLIRATKRENSRYDVPIDFIQAKWSDSDSSESSDSDSDSEEKEGETTQNKRSLYKKKKEKRKKKDFYDGKNSGVGLSLSCSPVGRSSPSKTQSSEPGIQWRHRPTINGRQNLKFSEKA